MIELNRVDLFPAQSLRIAHDEIWRGRRLVLQAGLLEIPTPSVVGLVGANGAGKTTLLHTIANVLGRRRRARVSFGDRPHTTAALVPQAPLLPSWLAFRELFDLLGAGGKSDALEAVKALGLSGLSDRPASGFSAGQRQAIAVIAGLADGNPLTLLDEPLAHIDLRVREVLSDLIRHSMHIRTTAVTIISSHSPVELADLCDWIVAIRNGEYSFSGPRDALLGRRDSSRAAASYFQRRLLDLV